MSSPYDIHNNQPGVRLGYVAHGWQGEQPGSLKLISYNAYEKRTQRFPELRLRSAAGRGVDVLLNWNYIPSAWREQLKKEFGDPEVDIHPLERFFEIDPKAVAYFSSSSESGFRFPDGTYPTSEQIERYIINASMLNALILLKQARETSRKMRGSSLNGLWDSLISDAQSFKSILIRDGRTPHTLPASIKLKAKIKAYMTAPNPYDVVVDRRARNKAGQVVTPEMIDLWRDIYAGQSPRKPNHTEVHTYYEAFLAGTLDVVVAATGELHNPKLPRYNPASRSTVFAYQNRWENIAPAHAERSGDRQKFKGTYEPYHKLLQPQYAGSIISVDDRQPPFKNLKGNRMWFYIGMDLASEAITTWVYGESKEGIILEFYRQMVRNYVEWGIQLPYELEGESSLNSSYTDTFLKDGAMFQKVRIEANNARGKRIEGYFRQLRYGIEKKREGWLARPHARLESNQQSAEKAPRLPSERIIENGLRDIETWNNTACGNEAYAGAGRWDVFMDNQHPQDRPYNWPAILSGLGYRTKTSMKAGRITFKGKHCVVGQYGRVATGDELINIMKQIEGEQVEVRWLDGNDGSPLKSLVYDLSGRMICELMGDLAYHRATLEQTDRCRANRELTSAYVATVQGFISCGKKAINTVALIEREAKPVSARFSIDALKSKYTPAPDAAEILPDVQNEFEPDSNPVQSLYDRM